MMVLASLRSLGCLVTWPKNFFSALAQFELGVSVLPLSVPPVLSLTRLCVCAPRDA